MTFSVDLDEQTHEAAESRRRESGKARNALIRQALEEWLARSQSQRWPEAVLAFKGGVPFAARPEAVLRPSPLLLNRQSKCMRVLPGKKIAPNHVTRACSIDLGAGPH